MNENTDSEIGDVAADADRRHVARRRRAAALSALAVVGVGLAGMVYLIDDRPTTTSSTSPTSVVTAVTASSDPAPGTSPSLPPPTADAPSTTEPVAELEAEFLDRTTEVYRRPLADGDVVVRRSDLSWADFFDLEWRAPTGSAELCMGDYALLVNDAAASDQAMRPLWSAIEVFADFDGEVAIETGQSNSIVVRTAGTADEVSLVADGVEQDRTGFVDGLAVLDMTAIWSGTQPAREVVLVTYTDGTPGDPIPFAPHTGRPTEEYRQECTPGPGPILPLPPAGEQPLDPAAAEAEILDAYARAVDRSILLPDEDPPSVDDITGIADAAAAVDAGQFADVAAVAEHTVDELVFTAPDEAWFLYTLTAGTYQFPGQYGIARFNGEIWQITRDTICQDLARAGGTCMPLSSPNEPPIPAGWSEVIDEYERVSNLYWSRGCLPPPFGPEFCDEYINDPND